MPGSPMTSYPINLSRVLNLEDHYRLIDRLRDIIVLTLLY
ncbi:hypothetical protein MJ1HA_1321 [Metallosphaera sedula]|nr:hypothetical protein MJ1HA_1321 [Metallosphaera sedula]